MVELVLAESSRYRWHYYCPWCGIWIRKGEHKVNGKGLPVCPECDRKLRTKPHDKRKRRKPENEGM